MKINELRKLLEHASGLLGAAGASSQAKPLKQLDEALSTAGDADVEKFSDEVEESIVEINVGRLPAPELASRLEKAESDPRRFNAIMASLAKRDVDKAKVAEVAAIYTSLPNKWKSKKQAADAIRRRYDDRVFQRSKLKQVGSGTPW